MPILNWKVQNTRFKLTDPVVTKTPDGRTKIKWKCDRKFKEKLGKTVKIHFSFKDWERLEKLAKTMSRSPDAIVDYVVRQWMKKEELQCAVEKANRKLNIVEIPFTEEELDVIAEEDLRYVEPDRCKGTSFKKKRWVAQFNDHGAIRYLGLYKTTVMAGKAYLYAKMLCEFCENNGTKVQFVTKAKY